MSTAARKARKRAGLPLVDKPKTPTPLEERGGMWKSRFVPGQPGKKGRTEIRPSHVAVHRHGITDLGWQKPTRYLTKSGHIRKAVQS